MPTRPDDPSPAADDAWAGHRLVGWTETRVEARVPASRPDETDY
ncbi:MAG: hypothetical protein ABEH78_01630 [Haloferacaceae archaeon]